VLNSDSELSVNTEIEKKLRLKINLAIMAICIILIYIFNNLFYTYSPYIPNDQTQFFWLFLKRLYSPSDISVLTVDFRNCLWAINLFLFFTLLGHFSFLIRNSIRYRKWIYISNSALGILVLIVIFLVFPFDPGSGLGLVLVKIALLILVISLVLNIFTLLFIKQKNSSTEMT
jgi:hypothetical protein